MAEKILIVDDDIDTLKLVGVMLERQGYEIAVASNGKMGISRAAAELPDLILLDVMMPDLDGYEVTRRLRDDPALSHIPIIMFTAKTMVDDKVAGFEAGVDDYLTKPTHPAELAAHVKAVLARSTQTRAATGEQARIIAVLGVTGGVGTTTLALNIAVALQQSGHDVILAEMNPGRGSLSLYLNIQEPRGLGNLLSRSLKDIHLRSIETEIISHRTGIRLLLASYKPSETELAQAVPQMEAILKNLTAMCTVVVLDMGSGLQPYSESMLLQCNHAILVAEPIYPRNILARTLLDEFEHKGIGRHKFSLALLTRERTSLQIPWQQISGDLGIDLAGIISPAPEQSHQASQSGTPLIISYSASLISEQLRKIADHISAFLQPIKS